ncbi:MAG: CAP domain-containing protein [Acidobacteriota bacterium]
MGKKTGNTKIILSFVLSLVLFCVHLGSKSEQKELTSEEKKIVKKYNDNNYPGLVSLKTLQIEKEIFIRTNEIRNKLDIKPLRRDLVLDEISRKHSADMVKRNFFSHINPDGKNPTGRAERAGVKVIRTLKDNSEIFEIPENIGKMPTGLVLYRGFVEDTPEEIAKALIKSWMVRPGHRANILRYYSINIGVGVVYDGKFYFATQNFH